MILDTNSKRYDEAHMSILVHDSVRSFGPDDHCSSGCKVLGAITQ